MRKHLLHAVLACFALSSLPVAAQVSGPAFDGGFVEFGFQRMSDPLGDQEDGSMGGAAAFMLAPRVGTQLGFQFIRDISNEGVFQNIGTLESYAIQAHLFYDPSAQTRVGLFYSFEQFDGTDEISIVGLEGVWTPDRGRLESRIGFFDDRTGGSTTQFELLASLDLIGGLDATGEYVRFDYSDGFRFETAFAGLAYDFNERHRLYAMIGRARSHSPGMASTVENDLFQFGYRISFGGPSENSRVFRYIAN